MKKDVILKINHPQKGEMIVQIKEDENPQYYKVLNLATKEKLDVDRFTIDREKETLSFFEAREWLLEKSKKG